MRFFLLELRARLVDAVIAISLYGKLGRAIPIRQRRLDAKRCTASAIERVELLRGMRGGERRNAISASANLPSRYLGQALEPGSEIDRVAQGRTPAQH